MTIDSYEIRLVEKNNLKNTHNPYTLYIVLLFNKAPGISFD